VLAKKTRERQARQVQQRRRLHNGRSPNDYDPLGGVR
jgi:hypothetical protein